MARDFKIQIRWHEHEKQIVDIGRGDTDFSTYVREAAMEKALQDAKDKEL